MGAFPSARQNTLIACFPAFRQPGSSNEVVEVFRQRLATRGDAEYGVNTREVVVKTAIVNTDDVAQRLLHQANSVGGETERDGQISKVVVITLASHGMQEWTDRPRIIL